MKVVEKVIHGDRYFIQTELLREEKKMKYNVGDIVAVRPIWDVHIASAISDMWSCQIAKITKCYSGRVPMHYEAEIIGGSGFSIFFNESEIAGKVSDMDIFYVIENYVRDLKLRENYRNEVIHFSTEMGVLEAKEAIEVHSYDDIRKMASDFIFGPWDRVDDFAAAKGMLLHKNEPEAKYKIGDFVRISSGDTGHILEVRETLKKCRVGQIQRITIADTGVTYTVKLRGSIGCFKSDTIDGTIAGIPFADILNDYVHDLALGGKYLHRFCDFMLTHRLLSSFSEDDWREMAKEYAFGDWTAPEKYMTEKGVNDDDV